MGTVLRVTSSHVERCWSFVVDGHVVRVEVLGCDVKKTGTLTPTREYHVI